MVWLLLLILGLDGELVLRNGKIVFYQGEYQQEGSWVRFNNREGELLQLPLKMVDFEATKAHHEAKLAKQAAAKEEKARKEAELKAQAAQEKKPELADLVSDDAATPDRNLVIGDDDVDGYVDSREKYSREMMRRMERWNSYSNHTRRHSEEAINLRRTLRQGFNKGIKRMEDQKDQLETRLRKARQELKQLNRSAPMLSGNDFEDSMTESRHESEIQNKERLIASLEQQIQALTERIRRTREDAAKMGI